MKAGDNHGKELMILRTEIQLPESVVGQAGWAKSSKVIWVHW